MPTIITTPKAVNANAYVSLADATAILTDARLYSSEWTDATDADKERAIIWGAFLLDTCFELPGYIKTLEQSMSWPRTGVEDTDGRYIDEDTIPTLLARANAEQAGELVKQDLLSNPELLGLGISEVKAGPVEVKIDRTLVMQFVPNNVAMIMARLGCLLLPSAQGSGFKVVKLRRS